MFKLSPLFCRYGRGVMWVDNNTLAYNANYEYSSQFEIDIGYALFLCGAIVDDDYEKVSINLDCQARQLPLRTKLLCEIDLHEGKKQSQRIELVYPQNKHFRVPHTICSNRQVTLAFMPCQGSSRDSFVISDDKLGSSRTSSPFDQEAPSFLCSNSVQYVPYTLLCDHRQDCADNSDEDFCQFRPCSGTTPLQCGTSSQV